MEIFQSASMQKEHELHVCKGVSLNGSLAKSLFPFISAVVAKWLNQKPVPEIIYGHSI